jgi:hypothetical protein
MPNGDPAKPFAGNTHLCCMMLENPVRFGAASRATTTSDERTINFYSLIPLHKSEREFKLHKDSGELRSRLRRAGVTELLDIDRPSVCARLFRRW